MMEKMLSPESQSAFIEAINKINMAFQQISQTGTGDSEFSQLKILQTELESGEKSPTQVLVEVDGILAERNDYH